MNGLQKLLSQKKQRIADLNKTIDTLYNDFKVHDSIDINLELGAGHGHWLTSFSEKKEDELFLGIDLISKRVEKANQKIKKRNLENVLFLKAEAIELLQSLPSYISIKNCYIMYPDPWPKKRHHKRRLVNEYFLELLAFKCKNSSKLFFMTDHDQYFSWTKSKIHLSKFWSLVEGNWPHSEISYFQDLLPQNNFLIAEHHKS